MGRRDLEKIVAAAQAGLDRGADPGGLVSLSLVDDEIMADLNLRYRGKAGTTDVLAFCLAGDDWPGSQEDYQGEIVISVPQAARQAEGSLPQELVHLAIHGALHLAGFDHRTPQEEKAMAQEAREVLSQMEEEVP